MLDQNPIKLIIAMENPTIQTDLAQILNKLDSKIDKLDEKIDKLAIGQVEIKGDIKTLDQRLSGEIKALDVKTEQLNTRVGNVEFAVRGVLIGIAVIVLGTWRICHVFLDVYQTTLNFFPIFYDKFHDAVVYSFIPDDFGAE
jgi:hypothetical protein